MPQQIADKVGIGKRAVNMRRKSAAAVIGEEIHLDLDTLGELERKAAELERKADRRQHAERKVGPPKRRKPAPRAVIEDPTLAEPHAGETGSNIEVARKAFDALASKDQFRFIHDICRSVGLEPFKMASPAVFGLADEELALAGNRPADVVPAIGDMAVNSQAEQHDDLADLGAEYLQNADHASEVPTTLLPTPTFPKLPTRRASAPRIWRMPGTMVSKLPTRSRPARISMPRTCRMPVPLSPRLPTRKSRLLCPCRRRWRQRPTTPRLICRLSSRRTPRIWAPKTCTMPATMSPKLPTRGSE